MSGPNQAQQDHEPDGEQDQNDDRGERGGGPVTRGTGRAPPPVRPPGPGRTGRDGLPELWGHSEPGIVLADVVEGELDVGTDVAGGVESRPHGPGSPWLLADVSLDALPRHYDAFGLLFGVRNYAGFDPVAPGRGLPDDASPELLGLQLTDSEHDHTWISWTELAHIDWNARAPRVDDRIHEYTLTGERLLSVGKASHHGNAWRAVAGEYADPKGSSYPEGTEWRAGDRIWRVERLSCGDVLGTDPQLRALFDTMRDIAGRYGGDNVRLVVWFDS